jgi:hypothetical protein
VDMLVDTSSWRYAVITVRSEPDRERLVIAYPDEETLKDLIDTSSIVALGYTSRADAVKNVNRSATTNAAAKRPRKTAFCHPNMSFCIGGDSQAALDVRGFQESCVTSCTTRSLRLLSSSTQKMYCPPQLGPSSVFSTFILSLDSRGRSAPTRELSASFGRPSFRWVYCGRKPPTKSKHYFN